MTGMFRIRWIALGLVLGTLALPGCSGGDPGDGAGGAEGAVSSDGTVPPGTEANSPEALAAAEAVLTGEDAEIVMEFPTDLAPPYPGARVFASTTDGTSANIVLKTADPPAKVLAHYESRLSNWKQPIRNMHGQLTTVTFKSQSGGRQISLVINRDPITQVSTVSVTAPNYGH